MHLGVLGTGVVGNTIGTKLAQSHDVMMGSRSAGNEKAESWAKAAGPKASAGTFADAARFGELLFNCVRGASSLEALEMAGEENLEGKVLVDLANPLDFSKGIPMLTVCNDDSLGERIQKRFPRARVVKALNTMNCSVMVNPGLVPGDHNVFLSGSDAEAKKKVRELLREAFGWKESNILDLGDITTARGAEMLLPMWIRLYGAFGHANFNWHLAVAGKP
ncbi:MAG TPA: NAD(P)-binding domain-containing protein [Thermoanaerobaculia bacterium]